jgi:hypothetical protein
LEYSASFLNWLAWTLTKESLSLKSHPFLGTERQMARAYFGTERS